MFDAPFPEALVDLYKVLGDENPADILTKANIPHERMEKLLSDLGCHFESGRPETAPKLRTEGGNKVFALAEAPKTSPGGRVNAGTIEIPIFQGPGAGCSGVEIEQASRLEVFLCSLHVFICLLHFAVAQECSFALLPRWPGGASPMCSPQLARRHGQSQCHSPMPASL